MPPIHTVPPSAASPPKLLDQVRTAIRLRHFSPRTEQAYVSWLRRFIVFHGKRHPRELGAAEVTTFLFDRGELLVRDGKGGKDRVTMLPGALRVPLQEHLGRMKAQHDSDLAAGRGSVALPGMLRAKYPKAPFEWGWQWVFGATRCSTKVGVACGARWINWDAVLGVDDLIIETSRSAHIELCRSAYLPARNDRRRGLTLGPPEISGRA